MLKHFTNVTDLQRWWTDVHPSSTRSQKQL